MEALLSLFLIPLGIALILSPIFAWVAMFRTGRLGREIAELQKANKTLSSLVDRLETRLSKEQAKVTELQEALAKEGGPPVEASPLEDVSVEAPPSEAESPPPPEAAALPESPDTAPEGTPETTDGRTPGPKIAAARTEALQDAVLSETVEDETAAPAPAEDQKLLPPPARDDSEQEIPDHPPGPWDHVTPARPSASPRPRPEPLKAPRRERQPWLRPAIASLAKSLGAGEGDWETRIGQNWLNIIGIVILVVGLVYAWRKGALEWT